MTLWGGIKRWAKSPIVRRRGPIAISLAIHGLAAVLAVSAVGFFAGSPARREPGPAPRARVIEVALLADPVAVPGPAGSGASPRPLAPAPPVNVTTARAEARPAGKSGARGTHQAIAPARAAAAADEAVSFGGSVDGLARGLAEVMGDPCKARLGPKPKTCAGGWAGEGGGQISVMPLTKEEQATYYAQYMPKCPWNVGCEGAAWISTNGTRSVGRAAPGARNDHGSATPMAAGPAGLGGLHDSVGRLGFNPDHFDRGFGD